jgi:hypothetical protein
MGETLMATPALAEGVMYVRGPKTLFCDRPKTVAARDVTAGDPSCSACGCRCHYRRKSRFDPHDRSQLLRARDSQKLGSGPTAEVYPSAMKRRRSIFLSPLARLTALPEFSALPWHRVDDGEHGSAVYARGAVRGSASGRRSSGSRKPTHAAPDAKRIVIDLSLAAVHFYKANGLLETGRGEHRLMSGQRMPCVFMQKLR